MLSRLLAFRRSTPAPLPATKTPARRWRLFISEKEREAEEKQVVVIRTEMADDDGLMYICCRT